MRKEYNDRQHAPLRPEIVLREVRAEAGPLLDELWAARDRVSAINSRLDELGEIERRAVLAL